ILEGARQGGKASKASPARSVGQIAGLGAAAISPASFALVTKVGSAVDVGHAAYDCRPGSKQCDPASLTTKAVFAAGPVAPGRYIKNAIGGEQGELASDWFGVLT